MEHTASDRDPELGQENVIKNESKSQGHGCQNYDALEEPLLPVVQPYPNGTTKGTGPVFTNGDGTMCNLPRSVAEMVGMDKELWEKFNSGQPAYLRELLAESDRLLGSACLHSEQVSAHIQIRSRMSSRLNQLTVFHLLFIGVLSYACLAGYVDGRPRSPATYVMGAEVWWYISRLLLTIWEFYEHGKRNPGEFSFKFNFQNLPGLKELAGEQKWKDMQECSDYIRVLEDLFNIISSSRQSQT